MYVFLPHFTYMWYIFDLAFFLMLNMALIFFSPSPTPSPSPRQSHPVDIQIEITTAQVARLIKHCNNNIKRVAQAGDIKGNGMSGAEATVRLG
jgi:hypothetical protein